MSCKFVPDILDDLLCLLFLRIFDEHDKFIPTDTICLFPAICLCIDRTGHCLDQFISHAMSHAVVYFFQIIDIPQNHGDTLHHRIVIGKHIFIFILIIKPCCRIDLLAVGKFRNPVSILPHAANGMLDDHHEHK